MVAEKSGLEAGASSMIDLFIFGSGTGRDCLLASVLLSLQTLNVPILFARILTSRSVKPHYVLIQDFQPLACATLSRIVHSCALFLFKSVSFTISYWNLTTSLFQ